MVTLMSHAIVGCKGKSEVKAGAQTPRTANVHYVLLEDSSRGKGLLHF